MIQEHPVPLSTIAKGQLQACAVLFCLCTVLAIAATATPQVFTAPNIGYGIWQMSSSIQGVEVTAANDCLGACEVENNGNTTVESVESESACASSLCSRCKATKAFSIIGIVASAAAATAAAATATGISAGTPQNQMLVGKLCAYLAGKLSPSSPLLPLATQAPLLRRWTHRKSSLGKSSKPDSSSTHSLNRGYLALRLELPALPRDGREPAN